MALQSTMAGAGVAAPSGAARLARRILRSRPRWERRELHLQQRALVSVRSAADSIMRLPAHQGQQRNDLVWPRRYVRRMRRNALADLESMIGHSAVGVFPPRKSSFIGR